MESNVVNSFYLTLSPNTAFLEIHSILGEKFDNQISLTLGMNLLPLKYDDIKKCNETLLP